MPQMMDPEMIIAQIKKITSPGTQIPKPGTHRVHKIKGWDIRRGEEALIYCIPNLGDPEIPVRRT
jgi:hypothetical protein